MHIHHSDQMSQSNHVVVPAMLSSPDAPMCGFPSSPFWVSSASPLPLNQLIKPVSSRTMVIIIISVIIFSTYSRLPCYVFFLCMLTTNKNQNANKLSWVINYSTYRLISYQGSVKCLSYSRHAYIWIAVRFVTFVLAEIKVKIVIMSVLDSFFRADKNVY